MGKGLFVNDLFNGEALSGGYEGSRGIFRANLFDGEPLGQTTPTTTTPDIPPASDSLISTLATTGGKTTGGAVAPTGGKSGGATPSAYTPYSTPAATDYSAAAPSDSGVPWLPIALIGGAVVLTVGFVVMSSSKKTATANGRRSRRNRRARRNRRHR